MRIEAGETVLFETGDLPITSRHVDTFVSARGPDGYAPVANTFWTRYPGINLDGAGSPRREALQAMTAVAARRRLTDYSDFVAERRCLDLAPQSDHLAHMPGETRRASTRMVSRYGKTTSNS